MNEALTMFLGMLGGTIVLISGVYIADRRIKNLFKAPLTDWPVQPTRPWPMSNRMTSYPVPTYNWEEDQPPPMTQLEACYCNTFRPTSPTNLALRKYRELMKRKI